jgi:SMC interacting uncharacterized protein involved in chromosome segregation
MSNMRGGKYSEISRLETQRTSLLVTEDNLRAIIRQPDFPPETREAARHELESCQRRLAEIARDIAALESTVRW